MAYPPPTYNLSANWWKTPRTPSGGAPDVTGLLAQLYVDPHSSIQPPFSGVATAWVSTVIKVVPFANTFHRGDIIQPDSTNARYYYIVYKEYHFYGFTSCYEALYGFQCTSAGAIPATY